MNNLFVTGVLLDVDLNLAPNGAEFGKNGRSPTISSTSSSNLYWAGNSAAIIRVNELPKNPPIAVAKFIIVWKFEKIFLHLLPPNYYKQMKKGVTIRGYFRV